MDGTLNPYFGHNHGVSKLTTILAPPYSDKIMMNGFYRRSWSVLVLLASMLPCAVQASSTYPTNVRSMKVVQAKPSLKLPSQNIVSDLDAFIAKALKEYRVPGAAVAVVQDGQVVLLKGYGVRDITKPEAVDENTIFQLASISKVFTAAAAATLVDQGKMDWDTPIINYLPEFVAYDPYVTRYMTMRDLLAMRTGWPAFTGDMLDNFGYSRAEILRRLRYLKPAYSFREVSQYSNPGYFVAGEVSAQVGQSSWNDLVENRLLAPLGMTRSGTSIQDLVDPNAYTPHAIVDGKIQTVAPTNQDVMGAAGAVTSTAADMAHWLQLFLGKGTYNDTSILKPDTVAEMYKRSMVGEIEFTELPPISETTGFYYGLGFDSFNYAGHHVIEKGGALSGVRTVMTLIPEKNVGIVVLANLNVTAFPEAVRTYYIETLLGRSPDADLQEIATRNQKLLGFFDPPSPPTNPGKFNGSLQDLVGVYENELYGRCQISLLGDALQMECGPAKFRGTLKHWNHGEFGLQWPGATSILSPTTFRIGADGTADSFTNDPLGMFTRVSTGP